MISIGDVLNYLRKTVPFPEEMPESYRATRLELKERKDQAKREAEDEKHAYVIALHLPYVPCPSLTFIHSLTGSGNLSTT